MPGLGGRLPRTNLVAAFVVVLLGIASAVQGDERQALEHFDKKIRPVLIEQCYDCHSAAAKEVKGGLVVDHRDGLRRGGDSGPAIVPGKPQFPNERAVARPQPE